MKNINYLIQKKKLEEGDLKKIENFQKKYIDKNYFIKTIKKDAFNNFENDSNSFIIEIEKKLNNENTYLLLFKVIINKENEIKKSYLELKTSKMIKEDDLEINLINIDEFDENNPFKIKLEKLKSYNHISFNRAIDYFEEDKFNQYLNEADNKLHKELKSSNVMTDDEINAEIKELRNLNENKFGKVLFSPSIEIYLDVNNMDEDFFESLKELIKEYSNVFKK